MFGSLVTFLKIPDEDEDKEPKQKRKKVKKTKPTPEVCAALFCLFFLFEHLHFVDTRGHCLKSKICVCGIRLFCSNGHV